MTASERRDIGRLIRYWKHLKHTSRYCEELRSWATGAIYAATKCMNPAAHVKALGMNKGKK